MRRLLLIFLLFLTSCASFKLKPDDDLFPVTNKNLQALNATYSITPSDDYRPALKYKELLWTQFTFYKKDTLRDWSRYRIALYANSRKSIIVNLILDSQSIAKKSIRGKIKEGYFFTRTRTRMYGVPLIYFGYGTVRLRIGLNNKNDLLIDRQRSSYGNIFFFSAGNTAYTSNTYKRH